MFDFIDTNIVSEFKKKIQAYRKKIINQKINGCLYLFLFCISLLCFSYSLNGMSDEIKKDNTDLSISISYIKVNENGKVSLCEISNEDSIEQLMELKNTGCKLSMSDDRNDQSVILMSHSPFHTTKQILVTTRTLMMWAYMAVHVYKLLDSGTALWTKKEMCPCNGQLRDFSNNSKRILIKTSFFTYYLLSLGHHGWDQIKSYMLVDQKDSLHKNRHQTNANSLIWMDTINSIVSKVSEYPYASKILTLALDSAAMKWDCRCPGYFFYPQNFKDLSKAGSFYFNGHVWMLLLNFAIFTTDLAIDYL